MYVIYYTYNGIPFSKPIEEIIPQKASVLDTALSYLEELQDELGEEVDFAIADAVGNLVCSNDTFNKLFE